MTKNDKMIKLVPAPWELSGTGYILIYKFNRMFVNKNAFPAIEFKNRFSGGIGAVMLVNYESSNVGPYQELLFIPGKFRYKKYNKYSISKIFVSTLKSVTNGRINWGIPKESAAFKIKKTGNNLESVSVTKGNELVMDIELRTAGLKFPVSTRLLPFSLMQISGKKLFFTTFVGSGIGQLAGIRNIKINRKYFPDISNIKPILAVKIEKFKLLFPVARVI
jgi:hypothetical protein